MNSGQFIVFSIQWSVGQIAVTLKCSQTLEFGIWNLKLGILC